MHGLSWVFLFLLGFGLVFRQFLIMVKDVDFVLHLETREIDSFQDIEYSVVLMLLTFAFYVNNI